MSLEAGTKLGRYQIKSFLGAGGMGEVYLAKDPDLDREVALKILPANVTSNGERMSRFVREAKAASRLNHPNIITIYEISHFDSVHFIATEFIDGETLSQLMQKGPTNLEKSIDIAAQIANALSAAHSAGIVHRDIKPANVMIRRDGIVKVLDFGLAKLIPRELTDIDREARTQSMFNTPAGHIPGTPRYMSPEQTCGMELDARTDIFSVGVLIYEMLTGHLPFESTTTEEPPPLGRFVRNVPRQLEQIVRNALIRDREDRYQAVKDMLIGLRDLQQEIKVQAELARSTPPPHSDHSESHRHGSVSGKPGSGNDPVPIPLIEPRLVTSHLRAIPEQIRKHWIGAVIVLTALIIALVLVRVHYPPQAQFVAEDTVVVADIENKTGDKTFDDLTGWLKSYLTASRFLKVFPDDPQKETLEQMKLHGENARITSKIARGICLRRGLKAWIASSIEPLGSEYVINLKVFSAKTGEEIASTQSQAKRKEEVREKLNQAEQNLRQQLGEQLSSIISSEVPLGATTNNYEALTAVHLGRKMQAIGEDEAALPFLKEAVEKDSEFAYAYAALSIAYHNIDNHELAAINAKEAYNRLSSVSDQTEVLRIKSCYFAFATGQTEEELAVLQSSRARDPLDARAPNNISDHYLSIGQCKNAEAAAREAIGLEPTQAIGYGNRALALLCLNERDEAKGVAEDGLIKAPDANYLRQILYQIALIKGDDSSAEQQLSWANERPEMRHMYFDWQTQSTAFAGQWHNSQQLAQSAIAAANSGVSELAQRKSGVRAKYAADQALRTAIVHSQGPDLAGQKAPACAELVRQASPSHDQRIPIGRWALAMALCGDNHQAQSLVDELATYHPQDTLLKDLWLPTVRAAIALQHRNGSQAIRELVVAEKYEAAAEFWPQYVRGLAFLRLQKGALARIEFDKIIKHRGEAPLSVLYPLAHFGMARAAAIDGDTPRADEFYQKFLGLWKDADKDLPAVIEANRAQKLR